MASPNENNVIQPRFYRVFGKRQNLVKIVKASTGADRTSKKAHFASKISKLRKLTITRT